KVFPLSRNVDSSFGEGADCDSSAGISRPLRSSFVSAITAILSATLTPLAPSSCCYKTSISIFIWPPLDPCRGLQLSSPSCHLPELQHPSGPYRFQAREGRHQPQMILLH